MRLYCVKLSRRPSCVRQRAAAQQPDAGAAPDDADARRAAVEHDLAEDAEQNLRRAAARGPADVDQQQIPRISGTERM